MIAGINTFSDAGTLGNSSLRRSLHNHSLPYNEKLYCVLARWQTIFQQFKSLSYSQRFIKAGDVPETNLNLLTSGIYA